MQTEIERKFIITELPDLGGLEKISYERHFLYIDEFSEIRIQKKWKIYEFERKVTKNILTAEKVKFEISEREFLALKKWSIWEVFRDSYKILGTPDMSLKIYHWALEWFMRVEIEFDSFEDSGSFMTPKWFGEEITGELWARDSSIFQMTFKELKKMI